MSSVPISWRCVSLAFWMSVVATSCSNDPSIEPLAAARSSGDALAALDCRGGKGTKLSSFALQQGDFRHIPAEELVGRHDETPVSLCGVMRANPEAKLAIIQFTSLECYSCDKWIDRLYGEIDQYGLEIVQVTVLTGDPSRTGEADLANLKSALAPQALWLRDATGELWKFFNPEPASPLKVAPLAVMMDGAARGFATPDLAIGLKDLVEKSNALLKVGLKPVTEKK